MTSPSTLRVVRSREKLREAGGRVTSVRLSPEAVRRIDKLIENGWARTQQDAIEKALACLCPLLD